MMWILIFNTVIFFSEGARVWPTRIFRRSTIKLESRWCVLLHYSATGSWAISILRPCSLKLERGAYSQNEKKTRFFFGSEITLCCLSSSSVGVRSSYSQDSKYSCVLRIPKIWRSGSQWALRKSKFNIFQKSFSVQNPCRRWAIQL